jgi:hypothetical protein
MSFSPVRPLSQRDIARRAHVPEPTVGETFNAAWDVLGFRDRETNAWARSNAIDDLNSFGDKVDPDELNKRYPDMDKPFTEPETLRSAQFKSDETNERRAAERVIERSKGFFQGGVVPFLATTGSAMVDPIGFGVGVFIGFAAKAAVGMSALGKMVGMGAVNKAAKVGATKLGRLGGTTKFGIDVVENMVANTISETVVYNANQKELQDYTARQALTNVIGGSVLASGLTWGAGKGLEKITGMGSKTVDATHRMGTAAAEDGKELSEIITPLSDDIAKDIEMNDSFVDSVKGVFNREEANAILAEADTLDKAFKNLIGMSENGDVDPEGIDKLVHAYEAAGGDPRHRTLVDPEQLTPLSEEASSNLDANLRDPKKDFGYNEKAEELINNPPRLKESINKEVFQEVDDGMARIKESGLADANPEEIAELELSKNKRGAIEEFASKCLGIKL